MIFHIFPICCIIYWWKCDWSKSQSISSFFFKHYNRTVSADIFVEQKTKFYSHAQLIKSSHHVKTRNKQTKILLQIWPNTISFEDRQAYWVALGAHNWRNLETYSGNGNFCLPSCRIDIIFQSTLLVMHLFNSEVFLLELNNS